MKRYYPVLILVFGCFFSSFQCRRDDLEKPDPLQYINYTLDGVDYKLSGANCAFTGRTDYWMGVFDTYITGNSRGADNISFFFNSTTTVTGAYAVGVAVQCYYAHATGPYPLNIAITHFPQSKDDFYEGTLSGQFTHNGDHTINASFKVKRIR